MSAAFAESGLPDFTGRVKHIIEPPETVKASAVRPFKKNSNWTFNTVRYLQTAISATLSAVTGLRVV
jgi:hypothetical protein